MKKLCLLALPALSLCLLTLHAAPAAQREARTPYYAITLTPDGAALQSLQIDSLGQSDFRPTALFPPDSKPATNPAWHFAFTHNSFTMASVYSAAAPPSPVTLRFDPERSHATLLGIVNAGQVTLPAVLYLPEQGALRIEADSRQPVRLAYDAHRNSKGEFDAARKSTGYVEVTFPAATAANPRIAYTFTVTAIYPELPGLAANPLFDGFRRNYLNIFQMQAEDGVLANHAASDPCAFVQHMYSEVARYAPPLAPGLATMDLVRLSLDRYLAGALAYGMPGYAMFDGDPNDTGGFKQISADSYPSMLVAAGDYVSTTHDTAWLAKSYPGLRRWTESMLATDSNGDGLVKYIASGNAGSWVLKANGDPVLRPSNWWDTIGFGYEDAYSNALAYHALEDMAQLADLNHQPADAQHFRDRAAKLKAAYIATFFNERTGILAGWRSADGKLHDYWFPWVNGAAVLYGLVPERLGNQIFDRLLAKMKEVGYTNFELGLPGNLIPVRREDSVTLDPRWGGPTKEDGSDGFQVYENGGATASYAFYTIAALYQLGRVADGDRILFPILKAVKAGGFEGRGPNGLTYDWKAWDGTPHGYEGFLSDNFMVLAALMHRPKQAPAVQ